ncbi:DUF3179 domain-containing protein [Pontibaca salina]|uniref:DUF3179 domain-containing protein n=1 Tax=Pontibaca salina TaxID=2795731 RepID=A0A934HUH2_9RHOB|nr:DUF3179 domain-containing protein [Pontibaca salina]MBI6630750.1 DUF3179 domain-containing protein [Pontibaca salina]
MRRALAIGAITLALVAGPASADASRFAAAWPQTDFARSLVDLNEVISGGPPKDGIPALSDPGFMPAAQETRLEPREPVLTYVPEGQAARAYPIRYLMWHEIVNDTVAEIPIAVTFCPLCNSGMIFDRRVAGEILTFGVSGLLRNSDMVMFDRQSESWWQQAVGQGIVGRHAGTELTQLLSWMESWDVFRTAHPDGLVMAQPDWQRHYGQTPYVSYDSSIRPFLYSGENPPHGISPLARVLRVGERAWPLERLRRLGSVREAGLTITWAEGQASALDARNIGAGREVGNIRVKDADGRDVVHDIPFAFAFHAFFPDGKWMLGN